MGIIDLRDAEAFSVDALALRVSTGFPRHLRWYAKHLTLQLGTILGPELRHLDAGTTVSELLDWTEYRLDVFQLSQLVNAGLPFHADLGDPLESGELEFREIVEAAFAHACGEEWLAPMQYRRRVEHEDD